jgi:hypothetical protein
VGKTSWVMGCGGSRCLLSADLQACTQPVGVIWGVRVPADCCQRRLLVVSEGLGFV